MRTRRYKIALWFLSFFMLFVMVGFQPAYSVDKSRVFTFLLYFSGLSGSFAGAIIRGQANETYDEYMHTGMQSKMKSLIDDYEKKRQQSIVAERVGLGLSISAILFSLADATRAPLTEAQGPPHLFGFKYKLQGGRVDTQNREACFVVYREF